MIEPLRDAFFKQNPAVYYDLLPTSANSCTFFVLAGHSMTIWQYEFKFTKQENGVVKWSHHKWSQQETFQVSFAEPFHVSAKDSTLVFVTASGRLFYAKLSEKSGRKIDELDAIQPHRPILALLLDVNSSKAFAFSRDFFFELKDELPLSRCDDVTAGPSQVEEPLRTVIRCDQVLKKAQGQRKP